MLWTSLSDLSGCSEESCFSQLVDVNADIQYFGYEYFKVLSLGLEGVSSWCRFEL